MKLKEFTYKKKDGKISDYNLMILNETPDHMMGIDLNKLSEEEVSEIKNIQEEYEKKIKPYMKAYRNFIKENIIENMPINE